VYGRFLQSTRTSLPNYVALHPTVLIITALWTLYLIANRISGIMKSFREHTVTEGSASWMQYQVKKGARKVVCEVYTPHTADRNVDVQIWVVKRRCMYNKTYRYKFKFNMEFKSNFLMASAWWQTVRMREERGLIKWHRQLLTYYTGDRWMELTQWYFVNHKSHIKPRPL